VKKPKVAPVVAKALKSAMKGMNIGEKKKHRRKEYTECIDEIKIRKLF
jgi:hypothetical protein